jgi:hypothetical protein
MQGDSCLVDITAATGILGVYYQRGYIIMGPVPNGYGVTGVFLRLNYRKCPFVNRASQLAPFTTEQHTVLRLAVAFSKTCLQKSSV